ncbi:hypothetical protein C4K18_3025 [Pseudomonas chlororaphis subsp. aurantiaca]|nr:hypothetical protein C4K18_3025 [Pseudomonas chlororaphis subsp. aurantiaca]
MEESIQTKVLNTLHNVSFLKKQDTARKNFPEGIWYGRGNIY